MAGYSSKKPRLTQKEVAYQIFLRTGFPPDMVKTTLDIYGEIVQEGLLGQVEVPIPELAILVGNKLTLVLMYGDGTHKNNVILNHKIFRASRKQC